MSEEIRVLKEILDNNDLDNYTIDDDECYLNGYARRCLKKVLEEIERLNVELELYKDNQIHLINQLEQKDKIINEVLEYLDISNMSFVDKNEIAIRLKGSDKRVNKIEYDENMLEEDYINRFINMLAMEYDGGLARQFKKYYMAKDKEIERLNNIIDELEKFIDYQINCNEYNSIEEEDAYKNVLDKLKELKGSDKE